MDRLSDGTIALGSNQYNLAFLRGDHIYNIKLPVQFGEGKVEKVRIGTDGNYYVALGSILMKVNKTNFTVSIIQIAARDILFDKKGRILVVAGTSLLDMNVEQPETIREASKMPMSRTNGLMIKNIIANGIYKGSFSNRIYLYGLFGVKYYENDSLKELLPNHDYLSKNIYRVLETPDGLVWMASNIYGVMAIYNNQLFCLDQSAGLPSNFINSIYADPQNQIWVASVEGLSKITYNIAHNDLKFQVLNFNQSDGLVAKNVNDITMDGKTIYASTEEGICVFTEADLQSRSKEPTLIIESVSFNEVPQFKTKQYKSTYRNNTLRIQYVGLSYSSFGKIKYKYRIKGLENNWTYTDNRIIDHPALPPGNYTFELMAFNSKGICSEIQSIVIFISPPFWQTWWFLLFAALFILFLIYVLVQRRLNNIKSRHQTREQLLNLENQNLEAQKKQAILLRLILDQSNKECIAIQEEIKTITLYLELNKLRFDNKFTYEIEIDDSLIDNKEEVAPMLLQPFIENAILHGIAPLKTVGKITVRMLDKGHYIQCEIEDNGVGRDFSRTLNQNRMYKSTGIQVTQKRIDLVNGPNNLNEPERFQIIDLYDETKNSIGTKIIFNVLKNSI
ncbi:MAG: hypothetical protein IPJ31_14775 [Bacteroidetes bacterium]|nr:hypothetical protein [Bacteroidota bacterium]